MGHRNLRQWMEEYAEGTLSTELTREMERHLASCTECQKHLQLIRLTRGLTRVAKLDEDILPDPGFSQGVLQAIEREKEVFLFWKPIRLAALQAIPAMAVLAAVLAAFAYRQAETVLNESQATAQPLLESYLDLDLASRWGEEGAVFSEQISRDPDRVVNTLVGEQSEDSGR